MLVARAGDYYHVRPSNQRGEHMANPPTPPIPLQYRTAPGVAAAGDIGDMGTFNARTAIMWKGDFLFRIYLANDRLFFIKLGTSKRGHQQMAGQFGLIGWIIAHFSSKSAAKKQQQKMYDYANMKPAELLPKDKANHVMLLTEISEPTLEGRSFLSSNKFGAFSFKNAKGKKKVYSFEDGENFQLAEQKLPQIFGEKLNVKGQWDRNKRKVVKVK